MNSIKRILAAAVTVIALGQLAVLAHAGEARTNEMFGSAAPAAAATRVVTISVATGSINVDQGDVVQFNIDGKSFTWQFDTLRPDDRFALSAIAPEGIETHGVYVYVAPNPLYRG